MNAAERNLLCSVVKAQPGLRGIGIAYVGASEQLVLQRPVVGGTRGSAFLIVAALDGSPATGNRGSQVSGGLAALGIRAKSLTPAGMLGDRFSLYIADGGTVGAGNGMVQEMMQMNMQFLALQQAIQNENRKFQTLSNASKMRHDVARNTITNIKA